MDTEQPGGISGRFSPSGNHANNLSALLGCQLRTASADAPFAASSFHTRLGTLAQHGAFKFREGSDHDNDFEIAAVAQQVAKDHGVTPTQIACAWILQAPGVTAPIIGATKTNHVKQIFDAIDIKLSAAEVKALEKPYRPHPIIGHERPEPQKC